MFGVISVTNNILVEDIYAQEEPDEDRVFLQILDILIPELVAVVAGLAGVGVTAGIRWMRRQGIPVTTDQETMFRSIVRNRIEKLGKDSWRHIREKYRDDPAYMEKLWSELKKGHVPAELQDTMRMEALDFAKKLKHNKEFRDFAKDLTDSGLERILKDVRSSIKSDYQKKMLDVIPRLASIAVDSAFDKESTDVESWARRSMENLKPLLLSAEAADAEDNLLLIVKSEINKRIQSSD